MGIKPVSNNTILLVQKILLFVYLEIQGFYTSICCGLLYDKL